MDQASTTWLYPTCMDYLAFMMGDKIDGEHPKPSKVRLG